MTPEERIKAAAEVLRTDGSLVTNEEAVRLVAPILNPVDFPPNPKWPTDETLAAIFGDTVDADVREAHRRPVGEALAVTDPIIKAALHVDLAVGQLQLKAALRDLHAAIDEAGL